MPIRLLLGKDIEDKIQDLYKDQIFVGKPIDDTDQTTEMGMDNDEEVIDEIIEEVTDMPVTEGIPSIQVNF